VLSFLRAAAVAVAFTLHFFIKLLFIISSCFHFALMSLRLVLFERKIFAALSAICCSEKSFSREDGAA
jgi:hypothetical protein